MSIRDVPQLALRSRTGLVAGLAVLAFAMSLVSCSDDSMCFYGDYAGVRSSLDSSRWFLRAHDTVVHGTQVGDSERRIQNQVEGGWYTWPSRPKVRIYVNELRGELLVGGRLGLPDTTIGYEVDSLGVLPGDGRSAAVRMEFRSKIGRRYAAMDSNTTYWNQRGTVHCTLPIDADLAAESEFSCALDLTGEHETAFHLAFHVVKDHQEYRCPTGNVVR